jgi:hypothetical protein
MCFRRSLVITFTSSMMVIIMRSYTICTLHIQFYDDQMKKNELGYVVRTGKMRNVATMCSVNLK